MMLRPVVPRVPGSALVVDEVDAGYGPIRVLRQVSLRVDPGDRVALIGANGAGKTTLLRTISGLLRPSAGQITFGSHDLGRMAAHRIARAGVVHAPEGRQVFAMQSVRDNLLLGARTRVDRAAVGGDLERVLNALPPLRQRFHAPAAQLSGGQQQMLAIGRAVMAAPLVLLIDELSLGLAPRLADEVAEVVVQLTGGGRMGLLVVEQNASIAARLSQRTYVLRNGAIAGEYSSDALVGNRQLVLQYLGA
jgi:branched-chain amino acid transport system ATP-binding protein